jgi:hypothetical protein
LQRLRVGERKAANPNERRVQPLQTLRTFSGDVHRVSPRLIGATRTAPLTVSGLNPRRRLRGGQEAAPAATAADKAATAPGLFERLAGLLASLSRGEHLGEVPIRVAPHVEHVRLLDDRNRLTREALGLSVLAEVRVHARLHLPPKPVCFLRRDASPELSQRLRLLEPSEHAQPAPEPRAVRDLKGQMALLAEDVDGLLPVPRRRLVVARDG